MEITWSDFEKVEMRVGTIVEVRDFPNARVPAFQLKIDFGEAIGLKNHLHKSPPDIPGKIFLGSKS